MIQSISEVELKPHPKFNGVKIGFILTKEKHPELSITILEIEPGVEIPIHTHEREVDTILVLSGEGEVYLKDSWIPVKPFDSIVVSPGVRHGVKNKGKFPLKCYIVHAPALW